ncbi:siderophore receptor protein, partial [Xanthomonas hortorum pv. carotae str. M081]
MSASRRSWMSVPARRPVLSHRQLVLAIALGCGGCICSASAEDAAADPQSLDTVHVTAAQIARQALGSSVITAEDIERRPPVNDLSQLLRTMPGVNLTGNSASGQYGNNRQIDLRGMGPENTLILVDGKPVGSRDAVRMGRSGERNTRGDTNWVPAEAVERIEVLRGPAAARYGSGASGGVVNIITKKPTGDLTGSMTVFGLVPQHSAEGGGQRAGFQLSGPLSDTFSFRLYGNLNKTDPDALDLNRRFASNAAAVPPAGREGVRNKDINGLLRWDPMEGQVVELDAGFSRQGNLYAGDRAVSADGLAGADLSALFGSETNTMIRRTASLTHRGTWALGTSRLTAAYEGTDNTRLNEGLAGGPEGSIAAGLLNSTATLDNLNIDGEFNMPLQAWAEQVLTLGFERRQSRLS